MNEPGSILIFTDWFEPGYLAGGPIRSLANLTKSLSKQFKIDVFTSNRDFQSETPYNLEADTWQDKGGFRVWYGSRERYSWRELKRLIKHKSYDKIYLNSLFSFRYTLMPLLCARLNGISPKQIVIAPRGMLGAGSLSLKSGKKKAFLSFVKLSGFFNGLTWHATNEGELKDIKTHFGDQAQAILAQNIPHPDLQTSPKSMSSKSVISLAFVGRISKVKNLKFALSCLSKYAEPSRFRIDLYGTPEEESYLQELLEYKQSHDLNMTYHGSIPYNQVAEKLRQADFLVLPSLNENYGHVIFESLASGTPVLISNQTPWRELQKHNVGWDAPLHPNDWKNALKAIMALSESDYLKMSQDSINYAKNHLDHIDLSAYFRLFATDN